MYMIGNCVQAYTVNGLVCLVDLWNGPFSQSTWNEMDVIIIRLRIQFRDFGEFFRVFAKGIFVSKVSEVDFEFSGAQEGHMTSDTMHALGVWWRALSFSINFFNATDDQYGAVDIL